MVPTVTLFPRPTRPPAALTAALILATATWLPPVGPLAAVAALARLTAGGFGCLTLPAFMFLVAWQLFRRPSDRRMMKRRCGGAVSASKPRA